MMVFVGMAGLGVDVGRLGFTATEMQTAVDAGAVAYAKTMLDNMVYDRVESPYVAAERVVGANAIDGETALGADIEYEVGKFDFDRRRFRPGGFPPNAVRASGTVTVDNIFAPIIGGDTSDVSRSAVAAFGGAETVSPTLPVALGECFFKRFQRSDDCSDLPELKQVPENDQNSCWSSLQPFDANASTAVEILPEGCCSGGNCGQGRVVDPLSVGDVINVLNGSATVILRILSDCIAQGKSEYMLPIVECGKCNQQMKVLGFAKVRLKASRDSGGRKGLDLEAICNAEVQGGGAGQGGNFGVMTLSLVK